MWYINDLQPVVGRVSVVLVRKGDKESEQQMFPIAFYGKCSLDKPPSEETPYSAVFIDVMTGGLTPVQECVDEKWEVAEWVVSS